MAGLVVRGVGWDPLDDRQTIYMELLQDSQKLSPIWRALLHDAVILEAKRGVLRHVRARPYLSWVSSRKVFHWRDSEAKEGTDEVRVIVGEMRLSVLILPLNRKAWTAQVIRHCYTVGAWRVIVPLHGVGRVVGLSAGSELLSCRRMDATGTGAGVSKSRVT
jgi:hypothetical protein